MNLEMILYQGFAGIVIGIILVLLALGLSLIFGLMGVVNFAHGAFYMLGAYVTYSVVHSGANFWAALVVAPIVVGLLGLLTERVLIRRLQGRPGEDPILLTFGLAYVLMELARLVYGKIGLPVNVPEQLGGAITIGGAPFPLYHLFVVGCALVVVAAIWLFLEKTDTGLIVRAGSRDATMVSVLGLDFDRVRIIVFTLGIALAALAGALSAPIRGVIPEMGQPILPQSFVIVVIGGKGSFWGTVASGIMVGVVVAITGLFYPKWADVVMFMLMAAVLLLRPRGLFGVAE